MEPSPIKAIMWDIGNVLVRFDHHKACLALSHYSAKTEGEIYDFIFNSGNAPIELHDAGKISSEEFFLAIKNFALFEESLTFEMFCMHWGDIFEENLELERVLAKIHPDIKMCLISNVDPIHWPYLLKMKTLMHYFSDESKLIRSYTSHSRKPELKMYTDALRALEMKQGDIGSILYIDDVKEYCDTFTFMGGNSIQYSCSKDSIEILEKELRKYKII